MSGLDRGMWAPAEEQEVVTCLLCGAIDGRVRMAMVRWRDEVPSKQFASIPRCPDALACRGRVQANGDPWLLDDRTPTPPPAEAFAAPLAAQQAAPPSQEADGWF